MSTRKPVAIFRHNPTEGPGYFATFLEQSGFAWTLFAIDAGDAVPADPTAFAGLAFMGGPMSVNDDLPWIPNACALIRAAVAQGVAVIGHCLGGQLMSKALGGSVTRNPVKELGWGQAAAEGGELGAGWTGTPDGSAHTVFQWHGETFTLPDGATRILGNGYCANQAFVLGPHLGMQCHVEMTPEMIRLWCESGAAEVAAATGPAVQDAATMQADTARHLPAMRRLADCLYGRWIQGLKG